MQQLPVLDRLLFNLNTIGGVPGGKRLSTTRDFITEEHNGLLQGFKRWRTDDRTKTVRVVTNDVETVILISKLILESSTLEPGHPQREGRVDELRRIAEGLDDARRGVENILYTYRDDRNVIGKLDPLLAEIVAHAGVLRTALARLCV